MKNPFIADDSLGITAMLVGLVVLVFTAVALTLVVDGGIGLPSFSSDRLNVQNDGLRDQINNLEIRIEVLKRQRAIASKNRKQVKLCRDLEKQRETAQAEAGILRQLIQSERESMELITQGKATHRLRYREFVRAAAIGESYDKITTRLGKEYHDVRISNVTDLGVSISHRNGASCFGFREMPVAWQKRLMYSAIECAEATAAEQKRQTASIHRRERRAAESSRAIKSEATNREIADLRRQIASLSMKSSSAGLEASLARNRVTYQHSLGLSQAYSRSSYCYRAYNTSTHSYRTSSYRPRYRIGLNASKSVPGSLETWEQRALRYQRMSGAYAARLASLRARLASLVARDPSR